MESQSISRRERVSPPHVSEIFGDDLPPHPGDVLALCDVAAVSAGYAQAAGYRLVAQAALDLAHAEHVAADRLRDQLRAAHAEIRRLRAPVRAA